MSKKHIAYVFFALLVIVGWNAFLIQRDDALYRAYYKQQAMKEYRNYSK
jgi:hypothetical protein